VKGVVYGDRWWRGRASGSMAAVVVTEKSELKVIPNCC